MDNGPHFRYIGDLWELPKKFKQILDIDIF